MIIRICGVNIIDNKSILFALTSIYGIGKSRSKFICDKLNINYYVKIKDLDNSKIVEIRKIISNFTLEGDLRREVMLNIKRLIDINCYRGLRHKKKLPVHGQRTRTNAKTCKKLRKIKK